jgi:hypothetical protein
MVAVKPALQCGTTSLLTVSCLSQCTTGKSRYEASMRSSLRQKAVAVCDAKIAQKGEGVGLSFYAFFANRNDDPELLMEAATWWIKTHRLDHFEKAIKIRRMVLDQL